MHLNLFIHLAAKFHVPDKYGNFENLKSSLLFHQTHDCVDIYRQAKQEVPPQKTFGGFHFSYIYIYMYTARILFSSLIF